MSVTAFLAPTFFFSPTRPPSTSPCSRLTPSHHHHHPKFKSSLPLVLCSPCPYPRCGRVSRLRQWCHPAHPSSPSLTWPQTAAPPGPNICAPAPRLQVLRQIDALPRRSAAAALGRGPRRHLLIKAFPRAQAQPPPLRPTPRYLALTVIPSSRLSTIPSSRA